MGRPVSSLHIYTFFVSRTFMAGAASQVGDTDSSRHLVSALVCRGPWMSTVVFYCWCRSDSASILLYLTLYVLFCFFFIFFFFLIFQQGYRHLWGHKGRSMSPLMILWPFGVKNLVKTTKVNVTVGVIKKVTATSNDPVIFRGYKLGLTDQKRLPWP